MSYKLAQLDKIIYSLFLKFVNMKSVSIATLLALSASNSVVQARLSTPNTKITKINELQKHRRATMEQDRMKVFKQQAIQLTKTEKNDSLLGLGDLGRGLGFGILLDLDPAALVKRLPNLPKQQEETP